jgi:hypothetical protein
MIFETKSKNVPIAASSGSGSKGARIPAAAILPVAYGIFSGVSSTHIRLSELAAGFRLEERIQSAINMPMNKLKVRILANQKRD